MIALAIVLYIIFMGLATYGSILYASFMTRETGQFDIHSTIAGFMHVGLSVLAFFCWFSFAWGMGLFVLIAGFVLGVGLMVAGELVLFIFIFDRKEKWIENYQESSDEEISLQVEVE
ncbi:hypothetical protein [Bacillus suaedae]|uniref:Uncharacterized protein n=1 Tax=Halalkalibacter suaedae TaxID=2822140 RepID=A0A941AT53_9BACI|nr:hypothetical protein [Bacillus suaedae]MBP3950909.1 hypothetical protein [Bacillus suaedae]